MGKATESIYDGKYVVVPLADVQHVDKSNRLGLMVITKHTRWNFAQDFWDNNIWIDAIEADKFMAAWCRYRHEIEAETLEDLSPNAEVSRDANR